MKSIVLFTTTLLLSYIARADERNLVCGEKLIGKLNLASNELIWIDRSSNTPKVVVSKLFQGPLDERCGKLENLNSLKFEITPQYMWGQVVLQIFNTDNGRVKARILTCHYDGEYSDYYTTEYNCSLN